MKKENFLKSQEKKLNPININILEDLNFGSLDGERDDILKNSFVVTKAIKDLLKKNYNYVLSPKGAGKSAVFKALAEKYKLPQRLIDYSKYHFIPINNAFDTSDSYLAKEKFKTDLGHNKYTVSWSFYIALKLIDDIITNHSDKPNFSEFQTALKKYDDFKEKYELYNILDYVENFNVALKFTAGGIDYTIKPAFGNKKNTRPLRLNEIYKLINKFYSENNLIAKILIDRIDNFVEKEEYVIQKNYLQGLVYAIEEISHLKNVQPLLFLRTDLFYSHSINIEYDKIRDRMIELKWTKAEMLVFIVYRFLSIEQVNKNHSDFFKQCITQNYSKPKGIKDRTSKFVSFLKIFFKRNKFDLEKNLNYEISYQFLKLFFPSKAINVSENNKDEFIDFDNWVFTHFVDGNNFINPRTVLRFLNLLAKKQLDVYEEHNLVPNKIINAKIVDENLTYNLFQPVVIKEVYEFLRNEELRNIYKLLYSKVAQSIFLRVNQLSVDNSKINYGDINLKVFNCEKEECDRILKYLSLLGYISTSDARAYRVSTIYRRIIELN